MIDYKLLFAFLFFSSTISFNYGSDLEGEEIIGSHPGLRSDFKYQAAIVGKYNLSNVANLLCGAGIISDFFLLSSIRCFLHVPYELRKLRFFAVVGIDILTSQDCSLLEIDQIFTHYMTNNWDDQNIAIAKLEHGLNLANRPDLDFLEIPHVNDNFNGQNGVVAGFGMSTINELERNKKREQIRISITTPRELRYANVTIINGYTNVYNYSPFLELICGEMIKYFNQLCGKILPDEMYDFRGVCRGDLGTPLVIQRKVVGIVSRHSKNCDDIMHGTIYTKVSKYWHFIEELKQGRLLRNTIIYLNPVHVSSRLIRSRR